MEHARYPQAGLRSRADSAGILTPDPLEEPHDPHHGSKRQRAFLMNSAGSCAPPFGGLL